LPNSRNCAGSRCRPGHRVTLLDVDEAHLHAINENGLQLSTDAGERTVTNLEALRPEAVVQPADLLVVFTKTLHTQAALGAARAALGPETALLSLQNGLGNAERLAQFADPGRVMIGVTTWPADKNGPGRVSSHGTGVIRLMSADGADSPMLSRTVEALNDAGLACTADADVWAAIWEKVAFNAALNSLCAVTGCMVGELTNVADGEALALKIVAEVAAVAHAHGVAVNEPHVAGNVRHALGLRCCRTCWLGARPKSRPSTARWWRLRAVVPSRCRIRRRCCTSCASSMQRNPDESRSHADTSWLLRETEMSVDVRAAHTLQHAYKQMTAH
jgi:2-dehydropantoate 2-reductase